MQERRHKVRTRRPSMHLAVGARPKLTGDPSPHLTRGADRLPVARGAEAALALVCCAGSGTAGRKVGPLPVRQRGGGPLTLLPTPSHRESTCEAVRGRETSSTEVAHQSTGSCRWGRSSCCGWR